MTSISISISTPFVFDACKPQQALASNMPQNNGADLSKTNTVETLIPIVKLQSIFLQAKSILSSNSISSSALSSKEMIELSKSMKRILLSHGNNNNNNNNNNNDRNRNESEFKKVFDEYSDPISSKQKFMDQNAFLVYYTRGYDGPNRPTLESSSQDDYIPKQTLQYGYRNDAWVAFRELMEELEFSIQNQGDGMEIADFKGPLDRLLLAMEEYFKLVPKEDMEAARLACQ